MMGQRRRRWAISLVDLLVLAGTQQAYAYETQSNTKLWANVVLMLVQSRRRWTKIKTTLAQRLVFAAQCSFKGGPMSHMLANHWANAEPMLVSVEKCRFLFFIFKNNI